ncbi:methylmalonyl-CoA epimerase, mitochondrial isoform X3 [Magallana gigas]|uniref:methylmalonyl-CoA epimerase, mitochondrial isoform X3 n=1 Tax=Magallana gigas TaxID=29159 RepID=UPI003341BAA9
MAFMSQPFLRQIRNLARITGSPCKAFHTNQKLTAAPQPDHGVYTVFVELGETKIELLNPLGDKSPIQNFLDKNKSGGMHHICIEVDNINEAMKDLKSKGIRLLSEESKIGAHGKPVVFLHPKDCNGVLVELEQV